VGDPVNRPPVLDAQHVRTRRWALLDLTRIDARHDTHN
jgi:hypothetical protein